MAVCTKVTGLMMSNRAEVLSNGLMEVSTKANSTTTRSTVLASTDGQTVKSISATGTIMPWMDMVSASGLMEKSTLVTGPKT